MRKTMVRDALQRLIGGILLASLAACAWMPGTETEDPSVVPFKTIGGTAFQGFLRNWDEQRQPVFCTLIRSHAEWRYWIQPAPVQGDQRPAGPLAAYFDHQQYLVVARVIPAPDAAERPHVFTPLAVTLRDGGLRVSYLFREPVSGASYRVKETMILSISKERYTTGPVRFVENDRPVCEIAR